MVKDLLNEVIIVEREIQRCIEEERQKAEDRLDETRRRVEEEVLREEKSIREVVDRQLDDARRDAERKAEQLVQAAADGAERLENLDDETLSGILLKRIPRILLG